MWKFKSRLGLGPGRVVKLDVSQDGLVQFSQKSSSGQRGLPARVHSRVIELK